MIKSMDKPVSVKDNIHKINSFDTLDQLLKENNKIKVIAVAAAEEAHVLESVSEAKRQGVAEAILVGDQEKIKAVASELAINIEEFQIVHSEDLKSSAEIAVQLVNSGKAQVIMKGLIDTSIFLKAILNRDKGLRKNKLLSFVSIFEIKDYVNMLIVTDPAINIAPSIEEKEIIMNNAVEVAHALGNSCPKVALVAPIEKVNPKLQATVDAGIISEKYKDSKDFLVGGPFGLDNAISKEAAKIKKVQGPVAGQADILLLNDLGVANVLYKSLNYFAKVKSCGIVVGARVPVVLTSRADTSEVKLNSIKMSILLAESMY